MSVYVGPPPSSSPEEEGGAVPAPCFWQSETAFAG